MRRILPRSIAARTLLTLLTGLFLSQLVGTAIYYSDRGEALAVIGGAQVAARVATIAQIVEDTPTGDRQRLVTAIGSRELHVELSETSLVPADAGTDWQAKAIAAELELLLGQSGGDRIRVKRDPNAPPHRQPTGLPPPIPDRQLGERPPPPGDRPPGGQLPPPGGLQAGFPPPPPPGGWPGGRPPPLPPGADPANFPPPPLPGGRVGMESHPMQVSLRLADGAWLNFAFLRTGEVPFWSLKLALSLSVMALTGIVLSIWIVGRLTRPLGAFAGAAERLGKNVRSAPLAEEGPTEVRRAVHAFNEMQERIRQLVDGRTGVLAAISHDLRTPITRLQLRAEFIDDDEQRARTVKDLDEMEAMIRSILAFARDDAAVEETIAVDLAALTQTVCDDIADIGGAVEFTGPDHLSCKCRPLSLRRALTNLVENAVAYGDCARVALSNTGTRARLTVDDDGPGIPTDDMERVFEPFYRVEGSRNRETGGSGIGLSVVKGVIDAHGGELVLTNRVAGGLRVEVLLPL